jgi:hypothetical protein
MTTLKDKFLTSVKRKVTEIDLTDELGFCLYMRPWSVQELIEWQTWMNTEGTTKPEEILARIAILSLANDDGTPLLTLDAIPALQTKPLSVLAKIQAKAFELNGLGDVQQKSFRGEDKVQ